MRVMYPVCCGLDVHKSSLTACLLKYGASGEPERQIRAFGTTTAALLELADWLGAHGCQHVAMESTGVYWKPVFNILEGACEKILLVNSQHIKQVPGRKTDVGDAQWIAELLAHGLLKASFIPPSGIRDLRDLTRYRAKLVKQRADQSNRIQKLLETGNIKLASVASDVLGASGREMLEALAAGESDAATLANMAKRRLREKIPQLKAALQGRLNDSQRWLLREELAHITYLDEAIGRLNERIESLCRPFEPQLEKLDEIVGVSRRVAQIVIAEIGVDMTCFGSDERLASWANMCPGNNESAGKRRTGKRRKGSSWLQAALTEAAWAASHTKDNYLAAQYRNIKRRRGGKRAAVAVGHSILKIAYHLLANPDAHYKDLGADYFETKNKNRLATQLVRRLGQLGYTVTIQTAA